MQDSDWEAIRPLVNDYQATLKALGALSSGRDSSEPFDPWKYWRARIDLEIAWEALADNVFKRFKTGLQAPNFNRI